MASSKIPLFPSAVGFAPVTLHGSFVFAAFAQDKIMLDLFPVLVFLVKRFWVRVRIYKPAATSASHHAHGLTSHL
jgi:hypothetical protein